MKLFLVDKKVMVGHAFNMIDAFKWVVHNHSSSLPPRCSWQKWLKASVYLTFNNEFCKLFLFGATLTMNRDGDNATKARDSW